MYYGTMTKELKLLYEEYNKKIGGYPDEYENAEYSDETYNEYVADIKKALELGVELPCIYPDYDEEFEIPVKRS